MPRKKMRLTPERIKAAYEKIGFDLTLPPSNYGWTYKREGHHRVSPISALLIEGGHTTFDEWSKRYWKLPGCEVSDEGTRRHRFVIDKLGFPGGYIHGFGFIALGGRYLGGPNDMKASEIWDYDDKDVEQGFLEGMIIKEVVFRSPWSMKLDVGKKYWHAPYPCNLDENWKREEERKQGINAGVEVTITSEMDDRANIEVEFQDGKKKKIRAWELEHKAISMKEFEKIAKKLEKAKKND